VFIKRKPRKPWIFPLVPLRTSPMFRSMALHPQFLLVGSSFFDADEVEGD
jgi:hypothetical protein